MVDALVSNTSGSNAVPVRSRLRVQKKSESECESNREHLSEEVKYVRFYKQTDLQGYTLIKLNEKKGTIHLEYYAAFGQKPYDKIDLTKLMVE